MKLKGFIREYSHVEFEYYREGNFYFSVWYINDEDKKNEGNYIFPVPIDDIGQATIEKRDKSILFMRWIRKSLEDGTIIRYGNMPKPL